MSVTLVVHFGGHFVWNNQKLEYVGGKVKHVEGFVLDYAQLLALQETHNCWYRVSNLDIYALHPSYTLEEEGVTKLEFDKDVCEMVNEFIVYDSKEFKIYGEKGSNAINIIEPKLIENEEQFLYDMVNDNTDKENQSKKTKTAEMEIETQNEMKIENQQAEQTENEMETEKTEGKQKRENQKW